jgi:hypothetical protein
MSEQPGSGASGHEAEVDTHSPGGEPLASSSSFVGSARRFSAIRDALGEGALRLAYHAAVPVVVNADLLNLLRVNFFLDDPPDVLPFEVEAELLLSPLFREIGEGLYEIDPGLRNLLLSGLHTRYGDERVHQVAALLERYTDAAAAWRSLPELELAQKLTALSFLDPAGAERWLDAHEVSAARTSSSLANDGPGREWYVVMRRRVAENSAIKTIDTQIRYAGEALLQLLSSGDISARLSVIHGLESLASLPDTDADEVVTVLCAFIQKWDERSPGPSKRVTRDVQAALSLIGSLPHIEFRLEGVSLTGANLAGLDFSYAIFDRVMLTELDAQILDLTYAQFSDVVLSDANLNGAFLDEAFLEFHTLSQVSLKGVSCEGAYIAADTIQSVTGSHADGTPLEIRSLSAEDETIGSPAEVDLKEELPAEAPQVELPESGSPDESSSAESAASLDVEAMLIEARTTEGMGQWERSRDVHRGLLGATLVTIHGFWSSPAIWDRLNALWREDEELRGLHIHPFGYPSPKKPRLPLTVTRVPDYDDIAQTLASEYAAVLGRVPEIAIVTHSEGGLILQRFLAWMVSQGRARELRPIRSVVMLACPNNGSEYLESLRRTLGYGRHPQAGGLQVLDRQVADTQRTVLQRIVNAAAVDDYQFPIPFHVYAGSSDQIVTAASAQSVFPRASTIAGSHFTILDPAAPGNRTAEMVKHHVLADIAATRAQPGTGPAPEATGIPEHPAASSGAGVGDHAVNLGPAPVTDSGPVVEEEVADNSQALRELSALPPAPPRRLRVEADPERRVVRLSWDPTPDAGCSSVVVRADGPEPPRSAVGQHRHVVAGGGRWEDDSPLVGYPMSYAVFTERSIGGPASKHAAVTSEPVLLTAEPQVTARPGNREVELSWTLPENAVTVEIQREELPGGRLVLLSAPEDGSTRLLDRNVRNEVRYRYAIRAVFAYQVPGQPPTERRSRPAELEVIPMAPPVLPGPVFARGGPPPPYMQLYSHRVELSWPPAEQGDVRILRSVPGDQRPAAGQEFAAEELNRYVLVLPEPIDIWMRANERVCYYTPILVYNGRCYTGEARPYATGPEVGGLRADHVGTSVAVTWDWPYGIGEALVVWNADSEPPDPVAAPFGERVARRGTEATGQFDIAVGSFQTLFVQVAVVVREQGAEFFSSGVRTSLQRRNIVLRYELRSGRGQRGSLVLHPDAPVTLPALVLFGRFDDRLAGRGDQQILRIPPGRADPGDSFELRPGKGIQLRSCRLFVEDEEEGGPITIVHPQ